MVTGTRTSLHQLAVQRQTALTAHLKSKQLPLFVFALLTLIVQINSLFNLISTSPSPIDGIRVGTKASSWPCQMLFWCSSGWSSIQEQRSLISRFLVIFSYHHNNSKTIEAKSSILILVIYLIYTCKSRSKWLTLTYCPSSYRVLNRKRLSLWYLRCYNDIFHIHASDIPYKTW